MRHSARAGGLFGALHRERIGEVPRVELELERHAPAQVELARRVWQQRFQTEFRSVQIMTRFLTETVGAGDPLDIYAGAVELVEDEIRHAELCATVCMALGVPAVLPEPVALVDPPQFLAAPMEQRAIATALSMLAVSETLSTAFITDLRDRCTEPGLKAVLAATVADEAGHQDFGWEYVKRAMTRFPPEGAADLRHLVRTTLEPWRRSSAKALEAVPAARRSLDAWPEPELAALGLHSDERLALVFLDAERRSLTPRLTELGLA